MTRPLVAVASASVLLSNERDKWLKRRLRALCHGINADLPSYETAK